MPIKDRAVVEPSMQRELPPPAPYLRMGLCSDCSAEPILCGDGELKVCPKCHSLLWHRDYGDDLRRKREESKERERIRLEMLRRSKAEMKARARLGSHQVIQEIRDERSQERKNADDTADDTKELPRESGDRTG